MIFVTVGTHEQPFDRLVSCMDRLKQDGTIIEDVVIQTGYSGYEPQFCTWSKWFPYQQMVRFVENARIVVTHGGPSSFIMPLQIGKIPIVVPRQKRFGEHVNDHQVEFIQRISGRTGIIPIFEMEDMAGCLNSYSDISAGICHKRMNNNAQFNRELERLLQNLL